jgi:hypothetical protein
MPTSNEYYKLAEECYRLANEAKTETDRLACLELASTWLKAAARQDEMTAEEIAAAEKLESADKPPPPRAPVGWRRWVLGFFRPDENPLP